MEDMSLFTKDWAAAQTFFSLVGRVPANAAGFLSRYGPFENKVSVEEFTGAVRDVNAIAGELGSPDNLKRRLTADREYVLHPNPPDEVYASIVWLSLQAGNTAHTISSTLELLPNLLQSAGATSRERAQRSRQVLTGKGGLASQAEAVAGSARKIADKVASYVPRLNAAILKIHDTEVVNQANRAISAVKSDQAGLQEQANQAAEKAKGWFGVEKAKEQLESLKLEIASGETEIKRKGLLDSDLGDFFITANKVTPGLLSAAQHLRELGKAFQDTADKIALTERLASEEQLGNVDWLSKALSLPAEIQRWNEFYSAAQSFTQDSLVSLGA